MQGLASHAQRGLSGTRGATAGRRLPTSQPAQRRRSACKAAVCNTGSDGGECIDAKWQKVRQQPLWQSLDAQLDQCWAAQEQQQTATPLEDSWDTTSDGESYGAATTSTPTLGHSLSSAHGSVDTLWTLASRTVGFSSSGQPQNWLQELSQVYVILFGVGSTDTEGIYSLRVMSREDGLPQDTIIAFSSKEDAERYSGLLEATMEHVPSVCPIEPAELLDFCADSGYSYRVEGKGSLLIPPDYYVGMTDWERSLRLREGRWTVMERDLSNPRTPVPEDAPSSPPPAAEPLMSNNASFYSLQSSYLLEEARARLERLLPKES